MIRISLISACLLLSACSMQTHTVSPATSWQQHQQQVAALQQWTVSGKLGYRSPGQGGSAKLNWSQGKDNYQMLLSGPFGVGSAKIVGNGKSAEMVYGDAIYREAPENLAIQLTGLPIPVNALGWWVRGLPSPAQPTAKALVTGADGLASGFEQSGWQLSFSGYRLTEAGILPGKINGVFNRIPFNSQPSTENRRYSFKLVISGWSFPDKTKQNQ